MALKAVVVHFMHEDEAARGKQLLGGELEDETASFLLGHASDATIKKLKADGLFVRVVDEAGELRGVKPLNPWGVPQVRGARGEAKPKNFTSGVVLVQLRGPLTPARVRALGDIGVTLGDRVYGDDGTSGHRVELDRKQQLLDLRALPFVAAVLTHDEKRAAAPQVRSAGRKGPKAGIPVAGNGPKHGAKGGVAAGAGAGPDAGPGPAPSPGPGPVRGPRGDRPKPAVFEIPVRDGTDDADVTAWLKASGGTLVKRSARKLRVRVLPDKVEDDAALPDWAGVVERFEPKLSNDVARRLIGLPEPKAPAAGAGPAGLEGDGQLIGVADTGLDKAHPDFAGRISKLVALGRKNDPSDPHGHGTHVAGTVLGDGKASGGALRGMAPRAQLYFQSLLDDEGGLNGLPVELGELFQPAYDAGVRVHNNSWGTAVASKYTVNSREVDDFVAAHRDMVIVISAGNEGTAAAPRNTGKGQVDWLSLGSPATAKNAITVGASRSDRKAGGYARRTYGEVWGDDFPKPKIASEKISGDPECLAAFSSRGPCRGDRRIKPDLVAPGTDILSTRSSKAQPSEYWGLHAPFDNRYAFMGGTSMAAPVVTGAAALVREYYLREKKHSPSAALVKATLCNGTRQLSGWDANADHKGLPNVHQGFGCVHLPTTLPGPFKLEFSDDWGAKPKRVVQQSGDRFRFSVTAEAGTPMRICLAYVDAPAIGLQNDLELMVECEVAPKGKRQKFRGNDGGQGSLGDGDDLNNVEIVRVDDPPAGTWRIMVSASNLLMPGQDFALVVTGALTSALVLI